MQATVTQEGNGFIAEVALDIATPHHAHVPGRPEGPWWPGCGHRAWGRVAAYVHPDHQASQNVAHAVGLTATKIVIDGDPLAGLTRGRRSGTSLLALCSATCAVSVHCPPPTTCPA